MNPRLGTKSVRKKKSGYSTELHESRPPSLHSLSTICWKLTAQSQLRRRCPIKRLRSPSIISIEQQLLSWLTSVLIEWNDRVPTFSLWVSIHGLNSKINFVFHREFSNLEKNWRRKGKKKFWEVRLKKYIYARLFSWSNLHQK